MTETRPTPVDFVNAKHAARSTRSYDYREQNLARCYLALAAENKTLEERVRALRDAISEARASAPVGGTCARLNGALAADDAKAGDPPVAEPAICVRCGATGEVSDECEFWQDPPVASLPGQGELPANLERDLRQVTGDNRASRRRAYVRDKAPVIFSGQLQALEDATLSDLRKLAIEQAGLIFDETEES